MERKKEGINKGEVKKEKERENKEKKVKETIEKKEGGIKTREREKQ